MSVCCWYWAEMAEYQYLLGKVSTSLHNKKATTEGAKYQYLLGKVSTKKSPRRGHTSRGINIY